MGEMLEKTRILWKSLGRPNAEDDNRKIFLRSMPSIMGTRLKDGKISILQMREISWLYIHGYTSRFMFAGIERYVWCI